MGQGVPERTILLLEPTCASPTPSSTGRGGGLTYFGNSGPGWSGRDSDRRPGEQRSAAAASQGSPTASAIHVFEAAGDAPT
jgi:hypothetical protein